MPVHERLPGPVVEAAAAAQAIACDVEELLTLPLVAPGPGFPLEKREVDSRLVSLLLRRHRELQDRAPLERGIEQIFRREAGAAAGSASVAGTAGAGISKEVSASDVKRPRL